ncbi:MAG TPA: substrate-binding domain-containing protein [Burkholderiaceae bacterium]|nr:substrate-binding domain-containing protein [Burkholderiaceae bacterium]
MGAQTEGRSAFRVCQDPNNLPFSNTRGEGFENKIAELFARELNLPVTYYSFPQRLGFIRNTLRFKLPGEDFRCDVVMGVPAGYDQVSATKPYYRSAYMLVFAKGNGLDGVKNSDDLLKLPQDRLKKLRIGLYNRTPGSEWLAHHGLVDQAVPYPILNPDPDQYPGQIIERDLAGGKIDAAIVWGPLAGYFASRVRQPQLVVVPMKPEQDIKFDFSIAMGVRYGEAQWKQQIEALIARMRPQIREILKSYNVPVLEDEVTAAGAN